MRSNANRGAFCLLAACMLMLSLAPQTAAQTTPTLTVDAAGNPHPINPDIYGIANYSLDATFAKEIQVPNIRWGGDGTTRYNWQVDSSNAGFDWYFMGGNGESTAVPSASADLMINTYKTASNAHTLLTIPIIPYVNKSAAWSCSFPVSDYGAQQSTNPYVHPDGDDCGNSIATNGTQLIDNNIYANHIDNTVALQQGWIQHLITTFGTAANGGVPYYQLDNEPGGWSNTHRDVEPTQPDYNTIISLGQQYAAMIKQTDPSAKVFGPVDFTLGGWIGTPSQQNNLYAGQYYLQQMAAYDAANHQRILDYFDEHYYGGGSTDAAELESTRALWDPTFNSGSWVEQYYFDAPMQLIPRFQNWIQTYYPGTKLSISEYSFRERHESSRRCAHRSRRPRHLRPPESRLRQYVDRPAAHRSRRLQFPHLSQLRRRGQPVRQHFREFNQHRPEPALRLWRAALLRRRSHCRRHQQNHRRDPDFPHSRKLQCQLPPPPCTPTATRISPRSSPARLSPSLRTPSTTTFPPIRSPCLCSLPRPRRQARLQPRSPRRPRS